MINFAAISQLRDEINELRKTIAYCEGRMLRKQIAIEEFWIGREEPQPATCSISQTEPKCVTVQAPAPAAGIIPALTGSAPSVRSMVEALLPQMAGRTFWYSDLKTICLTGFPEHEKKIRHGIYPAVHELVKARKIYRVLNGLSTTEPAGEGKASNEP